MRFIVIAAAALLGACTTTSSQGPSTPQDESGASGNENVTPGSTDIAARCVEGGEGATKDGWVRTIGSEGVTASDGHVAVVIVYSLPIDDAMRSAPHFAEAVWDKLIGDDYRAGTRTTGGEDYGQNAYASGTAVDKTTGDSIFVSVVAPRDNGVVYPVIAVAADEATLTAKLANADAVAAMRAYNSFPLSCASIVGNWTTESVNAVQTYDASGSYTGIKVSSLQIDLALDASHHYDWHANVTDNTGSQDESASGDYASDEGTVVLKSDEGKTTTFDAGFVAVKGGLTLSIVDRQFSGDAWVLYRAR